MALNGFGHRLASCVATLAVLGLVANPAAAAPADLAANPFFPDVVVAPGPAGNTENLLLGFAGGPDIENRRIVFDASGLSGVARVIPSQELAPCVAAGAVTTCTGQGHGFLPVTVQAVDDARVGRSGTLVTTVTGSNVTPGSHTSKVTVGEGVDLAAGDDLTVTAAAGGRTPAAVTVRNVGVATAHGAVLLLLPITGGADAAQQYRNCDTFTAAGLVACRFDSDLSPGTTYAVAGLEIVVRPDASPLVPLRIGLLWLPPDDATTFIQSRTGTNTPVSSHGTGPALRLAPVAGARAAQQTDVDARDNAGSLAVHVQGPNLADFEALGTTILGAVGDSVDLTVGVRNNGPVSVSKPFGFVGGVAAQLPAGTSFVGVPPEGITGANCTFLPTSASCAVGRGLGAGQTFLIPVMRVRIDRQVRDARGTVTVSNTSDAPDPNSANNTAPILVNPQAQGLPITGTRTGTLGAAGAVLAALGAVVYVLGRRRVRPAA
jgi:hypothetical protein